MKPPEKEKIMLYRNDTADFLGFEFATFRLREGKSEKDLVELSKEVDERFLSEQEGLLSHFLLRGKDGFYADVAIATTQERAEEVCQLWLHNDVAKKYLELLDQESVDMTFWSRIT
ncbi:MAG: hypothetical protein ACR2PT_22285 [Endozoicomonas sp.]